MVDRLRNHNINLARFIRFSRTLIAVVSTVLLLTDACQTSNGSNPNAPSAPQPPRGPICNRAGTTVKDGVTLYVIPDSGNAGDPYWLADKDNNIYKYDTAGDGQPSYYPVTDGTKANGAFVCHNPPDEVSFIWSNTPSIPVLN